MRLEIIHHTCYITEWKYETVIRHYEKQKKQINAQLTVCVCVECVEGRTEEKKLSRYLRSRFIQVAAYSCFCATGLCDLCVYVTRKQTK